MLTALMRQRTAGAGEVNGDPIDRYTIGHTAFGVLMGLGRFPWWGALSVAVGWEFVERWLKDHAPRLFPNATQDTLANSTCDALAMMVGWGAIQALPPSRELEGAPLVRRRRVVR